MSLYHKEIHWKDDYTEQVDRIMRDACGIILSKHLRNFLDTNVSWRRNYSYSDLFDLDKYKFGYLFEVETDDYDRVVKFVIRIPYNDRYDCVSVFRTTDDSSKLLMVTAWLNDKDDKHYTLDKTKYTSK